MTDQEAGGCFVLIVIGLIIWGIVHFGKQIYRYTEAARAGTVQALYDFYDKHHDTWLADNAAERASNIVEKGEGLTDWPKFLAALERSEDEDMIPILNQYVRYPVSEIRVSAAAALLKKAETKPTDLMEETDLNQLSMAGIEDPDPRVRRDIRCIFWHLQREDLIKPQPEYSPFVNEGYQKCKSQTPGIQRRT